MSYMALCATECQFTPYLQWQKTQSNPTSVKNKESGSIPKSNHILLGPRTIDPFTTFL